MRKRTAALCFLLAMVLIIPQGGCSTPRTEKVTLQLNWFHATEFAGYYVADAKGYYSDAGLEVTIKEGGPGIQARERILNGEADFAVASFDEQKTLVEAGEPSVAVMTVFQIPPLVMFALADSGIKGPEDMIGRKIGIKNNYWRGIERKTLSNAGIDPSEVIEVDVDPDAQNMLYEGLVDVWMGYAHDEPVSAAISGHPVTNVYPADYGVGGYEGLLLTNRATAEKNPEMVERFVQASQKGLAYAMEHPDESAEIIVRWQPDQTVDFYKMSVRALIPLVDIPQSRIGAINQERWRNLMGPGYDERDPGYTMRFMNGD